MTSVPMSPMPVLRKARSLMRLTKELPDRALQHTRHLAVRRRLQGVEPASSVLVVCLGNICRSPYLEVVLAEALPGVPVSSGGFIQPGRPVPEEALRVAASRGYDLSARRSRLVTHEMVRDADLVIVMDEMQARRLVLEFRASASRLVVAGDLDPVPFGTRGVADPWQQPIEVFESCFDRLDRCAWTLASALTAS